MKHWRWVVYADLLSSKIQGTKYIEAGNFEEAVKKALALKVSDFIDDEQVSSWGDPAITGVSRVGPVYGRVTDA